MLHLSSFHPKHIKTTISYRLVLHIHKICSDEEERNGHLKVLKDALIGTGYDAQLIDHQFHQATAKNRHDIFKDRHGIWDIVQYFPGAEKLHHVLRSLQHIINDDELLTKIFPTPPLLAFKQPPNLKQAIVCRKLPSLQDNIDHNTTQPCHGNLCKTCQIIDMNTTITRGNTTHHMHSRYSCDLANVVYFICC
eukprot:g20186.t1